ncbi:MAG: DUF3090 domain-containing protein [Chloroflexi bacterium]|nr:DUF3090 domain-containing protein [Chloroflexota bacterium]
MPRLEIDVDPCDHITGDAIGQPGQRVFYIQAFQAEKTYCVIIEKTQLQSLSVGVEQFLAEVARQNPNLEEASADYVEDHMRIHPPVDPLFRVGEIGLGYDQNRDRVVLFVRELLTEEQDPESGGVIRFWVTRSQMRKMARWGADVTQRGRPICPQCGQPMEPEGHFCPKKNGHKH